MKKLFVSMLLAAMTIGMSAAVFAAPSISQIIPEAPIVVSGNLSAGEQLVVQNANTAAYANQTVANVVNEANDENTRVSIKEILAELDVDTKGVIRTENKKLVNPTLYEPVTPFVDLVIKQADQVRYESTGKITATVVIEPAKDMEKKDALLMQIDPGTGKVYFVDIEKLDKETGAITATFPTLGPVALLEKVPVVVKDVAPEKYTDQKVAEVVEKHREEKKDMSLLDILAELQDTTEEKIEKEVQISEDKKINIEEYNSCMGFADLAIKQGMQEYLYDMDGELEAEAHRDIHNTDWERIVTAYYPDFDTEAARENLEILTELEPFVIEDSFVMQLDPISGEVDYILEPELYFAYPDEEFAEPDAGEEAESGAAEDEVKTEDAAANEAEAERTAEDETESENENELMGWTVNDEDLEIREDPNLVINAKFTSMGPFAIFMPKTK